MVASISTKSNDGLVEALNALTDALNASTANTACLAVEMVGLDEGLKDSVDNVVQLNATLDCLRNSVETLSCEVCLLRSRLDALEEPAP